MFKRVTIVALVTVVLFAGAVFGQVDPTQIEAQPQSSPVAFVYVSAAGDNNTNQINAFSASANGSLTPVSGSPFSGNVQNMALNGRYLFGTNGIDINSFSIAADGSLQQVSSINAQQFNGNCGGPASLFLDHSGSTLYDEDFACANFAYQFFDVDWSTGALTYQGVTSAQSTEFNEPLSFTGNNVYAYGASCVHFNPVIFGFVRNSDGSLTALSDSPALPAAKEGDFYCPYLAAADPTNHVAISVQQLTGNWGVVGPPQLATYTAAESGDLTTTSTFSNMPKTMVQVVTDLSMSPSGKLLAVGGTGGLQVFHFNGSKPITHYTGLLTKDPVDQFFWDNKNHLYAISRSAGKLYVFTITPASAKRAPGSPHAIANPSNIIVLPKT